eukprot:CAMPEP_0172697714 /NCGR_PEP_ID=MMETSP1074-20121228/28952_1 /TAXON_ID=2916 /ORGANISM="Ceratium fusus, Strain PA161109" /LENGTH=507 /DNA_ID=CAMNT_0013518651 /DNA_START=41 /DNA_END=1561 /DNA_ORIENTATION=+
MADGTYRQMQHVKPGDIVASWDESAGRVVNSTVRATSTSWRNTAEFVELVLPHVTFLITQDHPFWSKQLRSVVSANPNMTMVEYGIEAYHLGAGEELEGLRQESVRVSKVQQFGEGTRTLDAEGIQEEPDTKVEVGTLSLEPHHWYYVHGVRVHNKGCFLGTSAVTLSDGTRKQIQHMQPGDQVISWDEVEQRRVNSTVQVVPRFRRRWNDVVKIDMQGHAGLSTLVVTEDHPLWSHTQRRLVSLHPQATKQEYDLEAGMMHVGEDLLDEQHKTSRVLAITQHGHLRQRSLLEMGANRSQLVDVMTLCLEPHHWYYVEGIRVHNKGGCFAPWTPILMSDGSQKPIQSVRTMDSVASWDPFSKRFASATVTKVDIFPTGKLLNVTFIPPVHVNSTDVVAQRMLQQLSEAQVGREALVQRVSLIMSEDHPIYSSRVHGMVSMAPNQTSQRYGLAVGQMRHPETLHHHLGHNVDAEVRPWTGEVPHVMTLQLDKHHWFFAQGVRVHNKGG